MKIKLLITFFTVGILTSVSAQVPPSPASLGLVREASSSVNMYTGRPSINVPLFSLPHHNGHSVSIGLSYNASGHKVQDVAGPTGLGWYLHQGAGKITRVVRGNPDNGEIASPNTYNGWLEQLGTGTNHPDPQYNGAQLDTEYDLFFFEIPGASKRFTVATSGEVRLLGSDENFSVKKIGPIEYEGTKWEIVDGHGNVYYFNESGKEFEFSRMNTSESDGKYVSTNEEEYVSTWYLSRIDYYNSPYDITYSYATRPSYSYQYYNSILGLQWNTCETDVTSNSKSNLKIQIVEPKHLVKISSLKGNIEFEWSPSRQDVGSSFLTKIHLKDPVDNLVSSFRFHYFYSDSYDAEQFFGSPYACDANVSNKNRYRLMLEKITDITTSGENLYRSFKYSNDVDQDSECNEPVDVYELPPRNSWQFDHWGYYSIHSQDIPYLNFPDIQVKHSRPLQYKEILNGHPRTPNLTTTLANQLIEMHYPTGGYTEYEYELNYGHLVGTEVNENVGGLRIKRIDVKDANGQLAKSTNYTYEPGVYLNKPVHFFTFNISNRSTYRESLLTLETRYQSTCNLGKLYTSTVSSTSFNALFDVDGLAIEYPVVEMSSPGYGREKYQFYLKSTENPEVITYDNDYNVTYNGGNYGPPFAPRTRNWSPAGMLKQIDRYKGSENNPYETVIWKYEPVGPNNTLISGNRGVRVPYAVGIFTQKYREATGGIRLKEETRKVFSEDRLNYSEYKTNYVYRSSDRSYPKEIVSTFPDETQKKTIYQYVSDLANFLPSSSGGITSGSASQAKALLDLKEDHVVAVPIERVSYIKEVEDTGFRVTGAQLNVYDREPTLSPIGGPNFGKPIVSEVYGYTVAGPSSHRNAYVTGNGTRLEWDENYELLMDYKVNASGNLNQAEGLDGQRITYGYTSDGYLRSATYNDPSRVLTYNYEPLVGISEEKDINGKKVSYEYDFRNRLHLKRDHDSNIIERYRYNLANEPSELAAAINVSGSQIVGQTQTFSVENINAFGNENTSEFVWNFDGVIKYGTVVNHTYTDIGNQTVTLTILNPEYNEPKEITKTISITPPNCSISSNPDSFRFTTEGSRTFTIVTSEPTFEIAELKNFYYDITGLKREWFTIKRSGPGGVFLTVTATRTIIGSGRASGSILLRATDYCEVEIPISITGIPTCTQFCSGAAGNNCGCVWDEVDQRCERNGVACVLPDN
ncbi:MAG: hypothetical protein AAGA66_03045 [Bacteroidota bacterium]